MMSGLVIAVSVGFFGVPSAEHKAVTEMQVAYHRLIVGTWEQRAENGRVTTWTFRRNGEGTATVRLRDGISRSWLFAYRVDDKRSELKINGGSVPILRLDGRVLVWRWNGERTTVQQYVRRPGGKT
jgi:hypothetical protein